MSPIQVPLFWIPARCRGASRLVSVFSPSPVRASLVFVPCSEVGLGYRLGHERSTTFPWVASRPVQRGYDLSELRGSVVRLYHYSLGMGGRMCGLCYLYL